jgi:hypothetical protein
VLADLVAARRPTVTSAISELVKGGLVQTSGEEWVLLGEPPGELSGLGDDLAGSSRKPRRVASG